MKNIVKLLFMVVLIVTASMFTSCDFEPTTPSADKVQARQTEKALKEANNQIGMPAIVNYQERKLFKTILELRDQESLITYCYLMNEMNGTIGQFLGTGIGYGIPAATQFTNPEKVAADGVNGKWGSLPQADPNGLFMPTATSATWYMLLDPKGNPRPVYIEPLIIVSPFKLH